MNKKFLVLAVAGLAALGGAGFCVYYWQAIFNDNFHVVLRDQVYRSAQLDAAGWERVARELSLKTVVNLRGPDSSGWYLEEQAALKRAGVHLLDLELDYSHRPSRAQLVRLIDEMARPGNRPMLLHCEVSSDRVGLPAAFVLIASGSGLERAREQMSRRYGHFPTHSSSPLGELLDEYEAWLADTGEPPGHQSLALWAATSYTP